MLNNSNDQINSLFKGRFFKVAESVAKEVIRGCVGG